MGIDKTFNAYHRIESFLDTMGVVIANGKFIDKETGVEYSFSQGTYNEPYQVCHYNPAYYNRDKVIGFSTTNCPLEAEESITVAFADSHSLICDLKLGSITHLIIRQGTFCNIEIIFNSGNKLCDVFTHLSVLTTSGFKEGSQLSYDVFSKNGQSFVRKNNTNDNKNKSDFAYDKFWKPPLVQNFNSFGDVFDEFISEQFTGILSDDKENLRKTLIKFKPFLEGIYQEYANSASKNDEAVNNPAVQKAKKTGIGV